MTHIRKRYKNREINKEWKKIKINLIHDMWHNCDNKNN